MDKGGNLKEPIWDQVDLKWIKQVISMKRGG